MPKSLEHSATYWYGQGMVHRDSPVDQLDPRLRIIAVVLFSLVVVLSREMPVLIAGLGIALVAALAAHLEPLRTLRRVLAMDLFMLFLLLMLPFTVPVAAGNSPLLEIGSMQASVAGLVRGIEIVLKANAVILALLALVGTLEATTLGHALARLRLPEKLVHLLLFTVRYLEVISREYRRMRKAMKARAFVLRSNRHTWRSMGYLIGMLLVRSLERSERIHGAMKCRGFQGRLYLLDDMSITRRDHQFMVLTVLTLSMLIWMEWS